MTDNVPVTIPVAPEYAQALGYAVYSFSYLEWRVAYLCQEALAFNDFVYYAQDKTGGGISKAFTEAAFKHGEHQDLAEAFKDLVMERNKLVHAHPFTETQDNNEQRLRYNARHGEKRWTINDIVTFRLNVEALSKDVGKALEPFIEQMRAQAPAADVAQA